MTREEGEKVKRRGCKNKEWNGKKGYCLKFYWLKYIFCSMQKTVMCCGRTEVGRCCSATRKCFKLSCNISFIWVKRCRPTCDTPRCVHDLVSQSESGRVLCSHTFCANSSKSSLCLSSRQKPSTEPHWRLRLHETILGRDMNYHTEGNLNKMNSWITNISCLFCFSPFRFSLVLHESWGKWASLQPEKEKKKPENDNQIAAATTVWLVWYSALITENAEFIIYTFPFFPL